MKADLDSFKIGMADLRHYIKGIELESQLLASNVNEETASAAEALLIQFQRHTLSSIAKRRQFNYNSIIVSLYGFLEQFIESLLTAYVSYLNSIIPKYEEIPKQIAKNHISLSFALINLSEQSRYRGVVTAAQLISNLHSCISNSKDYRINAEAFAQHTANFRDEVIQSSFAQIGIDGVSGRVKNSSAFMEYLELKYPERDIGSIKPQEYLSYLNELAERRNQVAHGSLPDELLSNQILLDYISFFEAYGQALYEIVYSDALYYAVKYQGIELGTPKKILKNRTVVGIAVKNTLIRLGDLLVAQTANNALLYLAGEILELQVDKVSYEEVPPNAEGVDMGIRVPFKAKMNQNFFLIPKQVRKTETD